MLVLCFLIKIETIWQLSGMCITNRGSRTRPFSYIFLESCKMQEEIEIIISFENF